jgi:hypothetical protein
MKVPLLAGLNLAKEVLSIENAAGRSQIERRLEMAGLSMEDLGSLVEKLENLESDVLKQGIGLEDWPELAEEYAAFFSWVLLDMSLGYSSQDFSKKLRFTVASQIRKHFGGEINLSTSKTFLQVQAWVVGQPTSLKSEDCAVAFPFKAIGFWNENAALAYRGLIDQMILIEAMEFEDRVSARRVGAALDNEMSMTAVPVRLIGLAEALVNSRTTDSKDQSNALISQVQKLKGSARTLVEKQWGSSSPNLQELKLERNAIAHVWNRDDDGHSFAEVVDRMTSQRVQELGVLASFLVAAELSVRLQDTSDTKVLRWYRQIEEEVDRHWHGY